MRFLSFSSQTFPSRSRQRIYLRILLAPAEGKTGSMDLAHFPALLLMLSAPAAHQFANAIQSLAHLCDKWAPHKNTISFHRPFPCRLLYEKEKQTPIPLEKGASASASMP